MGAWASTRLCDRWRAAVTTHEFLFAKTCSLNTRSHRLDRFLGSADAALSCSPVQDLDKNMLDEDEARL